MFRIAVTLNCVVLSTVAIWLFADASFQDHHVGCIHRWFGIVLDNQTPYPEHISVLRVIGSCFVIVVLVSCVFLLVGSLYAKRTIRQLLTSILLIAVWLGFFGSYRQLRCLAIKWRVDTVMFSVRPVAESLQHKWPTTCVDYPNGQSVVPSNSDERMLIWYPSITNDSGLAEELWPMIIRTDGGIRFLLFRNPDYSIEFRSSSDRPRDYWSEAKGCEYRCIHYAALPDKGWYLVAYSGGVP